MNRSFPYLAAVFLSLLFHEFAYAELPLIRLDRLTPLGASAGATIEAEVAGGEIEDARTLLFDHPGITAEPIEGQPTKFKITVAADVPAGTYDVRLVGRFGVSNPRLFAVSHGLADVAEKEPNNQREQAQSVAVNSAIAGMSDGNGEDVFRFTARAKQRIVIECQAGKLDSRMDATLSLFGADGRLLASSSDYNGRDPLIDFVAPADGDYLVAAYDLSYRGGHPYRLLITDKPHLENVFPRAIQAGQSAELTALGRNFGQGGASSWTIDSAPLDEMRFTIVGPSEVMALGAFQFSEHPTNYSPLPTAATCTLAGFQVAPPLPGVLGASSVLLVDSPVTLEAEPNDERDKPQPASLPLVASGRFDRPRDSDWYEFQVEQSGNYAVEAYCERIGGRADPYVVVVDDKGNRVNELDDFGHRINAFDGHLRDPSGTVSLAEKRKYRALVQDRYGRGGARCQYVLMVRPAQPDFFVAAIHSQNPGPGGLTIWRGGAAHLDLVLHQREGWQGEITIEAQELPPGVHMTPTAIHNTNHGTLVFWADENAAESVGKIKLVAVGKRDGQELRREVRYYTRVSNDLGSSRPTRDLVVALRDSAPFALEFAPDKIEVEAGKSVELPLRLQRRWEDFKADVTILPVAQPGSFQLNNATFSGGQNELKLNLNVQQGARPGLYTLTVLGQAQVPYNKEREAKDRPNTLVTLPSRPITVTVKPPEKK